MLNSLQYVLNDLTHRNASRQTASFGFYPFFAAFSTDTLSIGGRFK